MKLTDFVATPAFVLIRILPVCAFFGTCAMISVSAGACFVFVRESLRTFYDPYTESQNNIERWIAETRVALAAPRPGAINLISGLPTS